MRIGRLCLKYNLQMSNSLIVSFALTGWITTPAAGVVGEVRSTIRPARSAGQDYFCAQGLAFDGTNLYLSRCGYSIIDVIASPGDCPQAPVTCAIDRSFDTQIPEGVSGLAFDVKRNGLWIGTQAGKDQGFFDGCGSIGMPIYFWWFNGPGREDDTVTLVYTVPRSMINPANQDRVFRSCSLTGLAYRENDPAQNDDDELWIVDGRNNNVMKFRLDGSCAVGVLNAVCATGFDASSVDPSLFAACSGLATSTENLSLATASCETCLAAGIEESDVFRAVEVSDRLERVDQLVADVGRWKADMECDSVTFSPATVMWVRTSPQGVLTNDLITAYEIEPGSCDNVPLGSCCDATNATCRDHVPQNGCVGSWTEGVPCNQLASPCFEPHLMVVLDRTGSMKTIRTETGETRCTDAIAAADYDIRQFFDSNPPGSTVAIWTFAGAGPTPLTSGFVDQGTAITALHTLDSIPCQDFTPLADAVCEAVDFMAGEFGAVAPNTLKISISSDGDENNSSGPCFGPPAVAGTTCADFTEGSWQKLVCDHVQGKATMIVRLWGDFNTPPPATLVSETDTETGLLRGGGVSDATFFQALVTATGGTFQLVSDVAAAPLGQSAFGVTGACCLPYGTCQDSITEAECAVLGGTHQGAASTCAGLATPCVPLVPAVSEWAVVAMALLVLTAGTVMLRRRTEAETNPGGVS